MTVLRHQKRDFTEQEWNYIRATFIEDDSLELNREEREAAPDYVVEDWVYAIGGWASLCD